MPNALIVLCTCSNGEEAGRLATALVEERLAACVNVVPGITSIYRWQGEVKRDQEVLLLVKTAPWRLDELMDRIGALHSYDTPEILVLSVAGGASRYLDWLQAQLLSVL